MTSPPTPDPRAGSTLPTPFRPPVSAAARAQPHFSLLATSFPGGPRPRNAAAILLGLWFVLFFCSLFAPPLLDDADSTHAQAARAIVTTGDLVTLHVDGVRYLEKAPLPYWLAALSMRLFGFNTFAAHLPEALAVALLCLLGHRWANQAFGARTAFYTSVAILTSFGVFLFTRILIPEVLLSLTLAAALFAFFKALNPGPGNAPPSPLLHPAPEAAEQPSVAWYAGPHFYPYVMWSSLAWAVLSKGLVALVFFLVPVVLYLGLTATWREARRLKPFTGILLFLALAAPWHILAAMRNRGPAAAANGAPAHGFLWFYFWNEHVLRFLGQRTPDDYNRMPGWAYWSGHLLWLFPWSLFVPLGLAALWRRYRHQTRVLTGASRWSTLVSALGGTGILLFLVVLTTSVRPSVAVFLATLLLFAALSLMSRRRLAGLAASPFHRIDLQQRSILLLSLFAATVLLFFSLSTNQEYYTFPAYLPLLLLIAATVTRAEQTYATSPESRRWITVAHAAFAGLGTLAALLLLYGLWASRRLPYSPDLGTLLAHRGVGGYTLSTSHLFDLTTASMAALRLPAVLAAVALLLGPLLSWGLRAQRRHIAATTAVAFTSAVFLLAAQIAFARFGPVLSSQRFAGEILRLEHTNSIAPSTEIMILGDQSGGSSLPFYLGQPVLLVDGRSSSLLFGSTFPDAPHIFLTSDQLLAGWGRGPRKLLFLPLGHPEPLQPFPPHSILLLDSNGKQLLTDRPLDVR